MMAVFRPAQVIEVWCWAERIGALAQDLTNGYYAFRYDNAYHPKGPELFPLQMPRSISLPQTFPQLPTNTYSRLPAFINDSLPDDFGNSLIDAWMARNRISSQDFSPLDRLAYIGTRGMGALEYRPVYPKEDKKPTGLQLGELVDAARRAVSVNFADAKPGEVDAELMQLIEVGTSAGGARAKAVVGWNAQEQTFISGQFELPDDFEHWLIKFDTSKRGEQSRGEYGRIEYAYYLMATECGIEIKPSHLFELEGRAHFMTRRFDRAHANTKHHVQTLCAMSALDYNALRVHDYAQLFMTAIELKLPRNSIDQLFARMVFNVVTSNKDDHTKNHAFLLREGHAWDIAPAYDITHAHNPSPSAWTNAHIMGVGGVFSDITREDILRMSERFLIKDRANTIDRILDAASRWGEFADLAGLSTSETVRVGKDITACMKLLW